MADLLIVDDNAELADLLGRLLRAHGYDTRTAGDGRAALEEILRRTPDVVLLDLAMPVFDGVELLEVLRSYLRFQDLPVVVLTAYPPHDPGVVRAQAAGIQGLFHKGSYDVDALLNHLGTLTPRG